MSMEARIALRGRHYARSPMADYDKVAGIIRTTEKVSICLITPRPCLPSTVAVNRPGVAGRPARQPGGQRDRRPAG